MSARFDKSEVDGEIKRLVGNREELARDIFIVCKLNMAEKIYFYFIEKLMIIKLYSNALNAFFVVTQTVKHVYLCTVFASRGNTNSQTRIFMSIWTPLILANVR